MAEDPIVVAARHAGQLIGAAFPVGTLPTQPQPEAQPRQSTYDAGTVEVFGQDRPPSLQTMDETSRLLLQRRAESLGVTPEEYTEQVWKTIRGGLGLSSLTPAEVVEGFDPQAADGLVEPGNIDLDNRSIVRNDDGSISTEESISFEEDGAEILIPTVFDGAHHSDEEAIAHYHETGEHLGKFSTPEAADAFAQKLHERQGAYYSMQPLGYTPSPEASNSALAAISDLAATQPDSSGFLEPTTNPEVNPSVLKRFSGKGLPVSIRNNNMGGREHYRKRGQVVGGQAARLHRRDQAPGRRGWLLRQVRDPGTRCGRRIAALGAVRT